jgi:xanthine dehydrogenase small subunit
MTLRFNLNGTLVVTEAPPAMTVLDWLREQARLTGTKEGCAEGDCGACTVMLSQGGAWQAVNSCIMLLGQLDGVALLTVEGLARGNELHPVQQALVETDGTQCGFCTPGFAMAMAAFHHGGEAADDATIHDMLAGNLCRCTGYRPIVDACRRIAGGLPLPVPDLPAPSAELRPAAAVFHAPESLPELVRLRAALPDAVLLAGGTDLGLRASKGREPLPAIIWTGRVAELREIVVTDDAVEIGAAVTYTDALPVLDQHFPAFGRMVRRLGSRQIRNAGTLGGNLGTASPIGDTLCCLLALDATVILHGPRGARQVKADHYFTGYRQTAKAADEVIAAIRLPRLAAGQDLAVYKLSKRFDQDISTVIAALRGGNQIRAAFGGMAAVPARAPALERALAAGRWDELDAAVAADFAPMTDQRGSAAYRLKAAANLARRWRAEREGAAVALAAL